MSAGHHAQDGAVRPAGGEPKVLCVFGTRAEAIKMAPVVRELQRHADRIRVIVCVTGQHREMLDQVLHLFAIVPEYDLQVMRHDQSLTDVTTRVLTSLDAVLLAERPDWVLVQGDTSTAMAAGLAASYRRLKLAHVEAGLRTGDLHRPFPEEINRRIVDALSDLHFAPTDTARDNLRREGVAESSIEVTGNTGIDALHWALRASPAPDADALLPSTRARVVLVTAHRHESFGPPLASICRALREIAERYRGGVEIVYPVHPNPNVYAPVHRLLAGARHVTLLPPVDYLRLVHLLNRAYLVLTDSGGIQEEAPGLGKPVLVLRETTERPEGVAAGVARVVGTDADRIVEETARLIEDRDAYRGMARAVNPYGDGRAAERIAEALIQRSRAGSPPPARGPRR